MCAALQKKLLSLAAAARGKQIVSLVLYGVLEKLALLVVKSHPKCPNW